MSTRNRNIQAAPTPTPVATQDEATFDWETATPAQLIAEAKRRREEQAGPLWAELDAVMVSLKASISKLRGIGESVNIQSMLIEVTPEHEAALIAALRANTGKPYNLAQLARAVGYVDSSDNPSMLFKEVIATMDGVKIDVKDGGKGKGRGKLVTLK